MSVAQQSESRQRSGVWATSWNLQIIQHNQPSNRNYEIAKLYHLSRILQIDERRSSLWKSPKTWSMNTWLNVTDHTTQSAIKQKFRNFKTVSPVEIFADRWASLITLKVTKDLKYEHLTECCRSYDTISHQAEISKFQNCITCRDFCRSMSVAHHFESQQRPEVWTPDWTLQIMKHDQPSSRNIRIATLYHLSRFLQIDEHCSSLRKSPKTWSMNTWLNFADHGTWSAIKQECQKCKTYHLLRYLQTDERCSSPTNLPLPKTKLSIWESKQHVFDRLVHADSSVYAWVCI